MTDRVCGCISHVKHFPIRFLYLKFHSCWSSYRSFHLLKQISKVVSAFESSACHVLMCSVRPRLCWGDCVSGRQRATLSGLSGRCPALECPSLPLCAGSLRPRGPSPSPSQPARAAPLLPSRLCLSSAPRPKVGSACSGLGICVSLAKLACLSVCELCRAAGCCAAAAQGRCRARSRSRPTAPRRP